MNFVDYYKDKAYGVITCVTWLLINACPESPHFEIVVIPNCLESFFNYKSCVT